jgi:Cu+-exporting ATPase
MEIAVDSAGERTIHEGRTYVFCCAGCRSRFEADPERYLPIEAA